MSKSRRRRKITLPDKMFLAGLNKIPEHIIIKYDNIADIEIKKIDQTIRHKFDMSEEKIKEMEQQIQTIKKALKKSRGREREEYKLESEDLVQEIEYYRNGEIVERYIRDTKEFIETGNVAMYISEAQKYIEIELIKRNQEVGNICQQCHYDMSDLAEHSEGKYVCPECFCITNSMRNIIYDRDIDKYALVGDEDVQNFSQILERYEGKLSPYPPESLYDELDDYFKRSRIKLDRESIAHLKTINGRPEGTSKSVIWMALENTGNSQYYDNVNYIVHRYWGWELPDLEEHKSQIIKHYRDTQEVWHRIKSQYNRKASLGTQFRLFVHLKTVGVECERDDFKIQEDITSLRMHNQAWSQMCEECGISPIVQVGYV